MAAPAPALMEELVEEILLRLPPAEPASLVRAALVCKEWRRLVSGPRFRRRFREFHRSPPMLGVICCSIRERDGPRGARFVPTCSFLLPLAEHRGWHALDARHGRVLLSSVGGWPRRLAVWDPMADDLCQLRTGPTLHGRNATVLCAATGTCDHLDCLGGPFLVVTVAIRPQQMNLCVYSSETGAWGKKTYVVAEGLFLFNLSPTALVGNTLYFMAGCYRKDLTYALAMQLASWETSLINLPLMYPIPTLMTMENGGLGVARLDLPAGLISLWSREANPNGDMGWMQIRVIELEKLLPVNACSIPCYFDGFAHGGIFFVGTHDGLFSFDLKSGRVRKVCDEDFDDNCILRVMPYMSFYSPPALGAVSTVAATDQE